MDIGEFSYLSFPFCPFIFLDRFFCSAKDTLQNKGCISPYSKVRVIMQPSSLVYYILKNVVGVYTYHTGHCSCDFVFCNVEQ